MAMTRDTKQEESKKKWQITLAPYSITSGFVIYTPIDIINLSKTYTGSLAIQNFIRGASLSDMRKIMKAMYCVCSEDLLIHLHSHHVFIQIVHTCPRSICDLVPLIEHPVHLACHVFGCRVMIAIVQFYQGLDSFLLPIMRRILFVSADTYGKHVVRAILEHDACCSSYKQAILCLIQKIPEQFVLRRTDVLSAALVYGTPKQRREIALCVLHTDAFASIMQSSKEMRVRCRELIFSIIGLLQAPQEP